MIIPRILFRIVPLFALLAAGGQAQAGFLVKAFDSASSVTSLAAADALIGGSGVIASASGTYGVVDFWDGSGETAHFGNNSPFPGGFTDTFALHATGNILIDAAGTYTFGTSSDDGVRLKIDGTAVIVDDAQHAPENRFGTVTLSAGLHTVDLVFFENGGGAEVELFARSGSFSSFNSDFKLVGDTASGGLAVVPEPSSFFLAGLGLLAIGFSTRARRTEDNRVSFI